MTVGAIIETLDRLGVDVELGINCKARAKPSPEAAALLDMLTAQREAAIAHLISGRFAPLPAAPPGWLVPNGGTLNAAQRKYILDAPGEILTALGVGHDPRFALLWAVKALCFISGGREAYDRIVNVLRDPLGFEADAYSAEIEATGGGRNEL